MTKAREIIEAWATSINPTEQQKQLAEKRLTICNTLDSGRPCWHKSNFIITHCAACGCPLSKKVFSPKERGCEMGHW